jgi:tRNA threonylcarbamoyladenosine biosynthesis protein TsaB
VYLLALESSSSLASVALLTPHGITLREDDGSAAKASDTMLAMVDAVLAEARVSKHELSAVAYGQGPGAFTGLRTACAVAQGIAFGLQLRAIGITSLQALAEHAYAQHGSTQVMAVLDARMNEVYAQALQRDANNAWQALGVIAVVPVNAMAWPAAGAWQGVGNAWHSAELAPALRAATPAQVRVPQQAALPHAREVAQLAARLLTAESAPHCANPMLDALAEPLYVRDRVAQTTAERLAAKRAEVSA